MNKNQRDIYLNIYKSSLFGEKYSDLGNGDSVIYPYRKLQHILKHNQQSENINIYKLHVVK